LDTTARLGGWLFRYRTAIPIPFAATILILRPEVSGDPGSWVTVTGLTLTMVGELVRIWAVRHIGTISRTRSDRLGPLVVTGPFALMRNPLYVGNVALWVGFALAARLTWGALLIAVLLAVEYHAIVGWEERLLEARVGETYRSYAGQVPRWIPRLTPVAERHSELSVVGVRVAEQPGTLYSWRETFFSERGTLIAIVLGYLLLLAKARL
jgi:protein-S-isoprenylcysteine O-methyltransferase Ste14